MPLRAAGCSSLVISCGTPVALHRNSARGAPSLHRRCASCPTFILVTLPSRCSAKAHTKKAPVTATLWAGRDIVCYLRQESNVFETYWTTVRGVEAMDSARKCLSHSVVGGQAR